MCSTTCAFERNALRTVTALQRHINLLLDRPQPSSPLTGAQLAIHHLLRANTRGGLPYLLDTVLETLDVAVENQQDATTLVHGVDRLCWRDDLSNGLEAVQAPASSIGAERR